MRRAAAAAALALAVTACGSGLSHGTVTGKSYQAPWTFWTSQCVSYTKYGACRIRIPIPVDEPAEYTLDLKDGKQTGSVDVDQQSWDAARTGEHWPPGSAS
jgi:hypothetical protein